jgi:metal-responsive CopG/Arc/MetJ family transcriptional regulator
MSKKIQVSFSEKLAELLSNLKGELGESESEVVRSIVISWLAEKSFISTIAKKRLAEMDVIPLTEDKVN